MYSEMEDRSMRDNLSRSKSFVDDRSSTVPLAVLPFAVSPLIERTLFARVRFFPFALISGMVACLAPLTLWAQPLATSSYTVLSVTPNEVLVQIQPKYETDQVHDTSGYAYTEMTFPGGVITDSAGAPEVMRLPLEFLTPSTQPATVEIVSQSLEVLPNIDLAPVPANVKRIGDAPFEKFIVGNQYYTTVSSDLVQTGTAHIFRTAYSEQITISPISYDPGSRSITRVKSLTLRIRFASAANAELPAPAISPEEASLFRAIFLNGGISDFYTCAWRENSWKWLASKASPGISVLSSGGGGQWLQVTTGAEGVYRITAQDLANAGITGTIDPNTIELFGMGGAMLNETVTDSSGEWLQQPIEVRAAGQGLSELYFYASGVSVWRYSSAIPGMDGVFHNLNPYTSSGHFLLKIGGTPIATPLRVTTGSDSLLLPAVASDRVLAASVHENDHMLEDDNLGREMLDQAIPAVDQSGQGAPPLQITLDAPGYISSDSALLRVAWDSKIGTSYPAPPELGYLNVVLNGQNLRNDTGRANDDNFIDRNWDDPYYLFHSVQSPLNLSLTFTSTNVGSIAKLDFVELIYWRGTDIGSQSIPFLLLDTPAAFQYQFTNASGGEIWDVTNSQAPNIVATANGSSMSVSLQGQHLAMRQFLAFSGQSVLSPSLAAITAPSLRATVCQTGATEIIVTPQAFLQQANELAQLREEGGDATEAMSAAVVTIDDIYREFGYGNNDIVALRDFMAYTFHHASAKPVYLTLLGGGHCDYQNRATSAPDWLPPYEVESMGYPRDFRTGISREPFPDDDFFVTFTGDSGPDLAVGRISARNSADADVYVQKVRHYEHGSDTGSWRSLATFLADDHRDPEFNQQGEGNVDPLDHFQDTQNEITHLQDRVLVHKIYESSYPTVISKTGQHTKPAVNQAILDAFNTGTVIFSFIGHGNPNVWTHEGVLSAPSSIDAMTNYDRLAYVTTATCNFSQWDDYTTFSGGEEFLMSPTGGAIGLLGTSRSVTSGEALPQTFYQVLFHQDSDKGTSTVGEALLAGKPAGGDAEYFYLLGDPAQRLLLPKLYVNFDSLNGSPLSNNPTPLAALSQVRVAGSIRNGSTDATVDESFNGTVTVTLFDSPTSVTASSYFPDAIPPRTWVDNYSIEGPILFRGTATVTNGRFSVAFIIPLDVKLDSGAAKFSGYAYSTADGRTALGDNKGIQLTGSDTPQSSGDTAGPTLHVWIGSRSFQSGGAVSMHSTAIVDVSDLHGLNTSTASIGHSFIAWVDNAQDSAIDMASTYISKPNDFTSGTSIHAIELPAGHHTLHVRAFNTYDNPSFASVDFVAKEGAPYQLYGVTNVPNPIQDHTTFSFVQPGLAGSLVNVTLSLYSIDGRFVRSLAISSRESDIEIPWDGRDATGTTVANGVYIFTVNVRDVGDGTSSSAMGKCVVER